MTQMENVVLLTGPLKIKHRRDQTMPLSVGGMPGTLSRDLTVLPQGLW